MTDVVKITQFPAYKRNMGHAAFNYALVSVSCAVCNNHQGSVWSLSHIDDGYCIPFAEVIYIIPPDHDECRKLFNLSPLAYYDESQNRP